MLKILIVDDSIITRKQIAKIVTSLGHTVAGNAKNYTEALDSYEAGDIDLVTMDITMPGTDGIMTTQNLMQKHPDAKVIMVTSQGQEDKVVNAMRAGALGYILKPITKERLEKAIKKIFGEDEFDLTFD